MYSIKETNIYHFKAFYKTIDIK